MATTIKLKNSVTTTNAPSSLAQGEVAINITDKKVWVGDAATTPIQLLGAGGSASFGALSCTSLTNSGLTSGRVTYATTAGLLTDSANLTFNGTTLTAAALTSTGVATFSAGTVSAPALTTTGDTNTGIFFPAADTIAFTEGGVEAMRIDSSGNVGIGTTSPTTNLTIDTKALNYTDGINLVNSTSWGYGSSVNFVNIPTNGGSLTTVAQIQQYYQASNKYGLGLFTYDSSLGVSLTVNPNGNIALKGGSQTASGVGITFPATQSASSDANCLDDYEEGTWTPVLNRDGSSPTITYASRPATYVKIGQMVYCMAEISVTSVSVAGSGLNQITGLPFTAETASGGGGSGRWGGFLSLNSALTSADSFYVIANSTYGYFQNLTNQTNPNANYASGNLWIVIVYKTSA